jgi:hypothetical protein
MPSEVLPLVFKQVLRTCPITDSITAALGSEDGNISAGAEARYHFVGLAARLKSCPFKTVPLSKSFLVRF